MSKTYIIAEAGVNHNGSAEMAKRLIDAAVEAGADAVKFQIFKASELVTARAERVAYQKRNTGDSGGQFEMLKNLELTHEEYESLFKYADEKGIEIFSTAFDMESFQFLRGLNVRRYKIASGEITNYPLLKAVASTDQPVIISTGTANLGEIESALAVFESHGVSFEKITVLHCTTAYPAPLANVNLRAMDTIAAAFPGVGVGFSDHTEGNVAAIAATARGAQVIEKHFTLDRSLPGPDHQASLEPDDLKEMVEGIRSVESLLGDSRKRMSSVELANVVAIRKSIVASGNIKKGDTFTEANLTTKRPGDGISAMAWPDLIGQIARRDYEQDEQID